MAEYSEQFDKERKYRVEISYFKYGPARDNYASGRVDAIATAEKCIEAFKKDHNTEHLVDAANYLMFRYMYPLPGEYFKATDSNGSVGTVGTPINMEKRTKMIKIERYDDYPRIKKQAGNFLDRIYFAVKEYRKCYGESRTPVIFMSQDVLSVLCKGLPDVERHCARSRRIEVAGHEVKLTPGTNILFIGFEI